MSAGLGNALKNRLNNRKIQQQIKMGDITYRNRYIDSYMAQTLNATAEASICEQNTVDDYLSKVSQRRKDFVKDISHEFISIVKPKCEKSVNLFDCFVNGNLKDELEKINALNEQIKIMRRPEWDRSISAEEMKFIEEEAFISWRKSLSLQFQESKMALTPYEKNLEVWRQLWRAVEKSDLVVQIVDARNPMLYWSQDLFRYAKDQNKKCLLLVNKADFLTEKMRRVWKNIFDQKQINFCYFSAKEITAKNQSDIFKGEINGEINGENNDEIDKNRKNFKVENKEKIKGEFQAKKFQIDEKNKGENYSEKYDEIDKNRKNFKVENKENFEGEFQNKNKAKKFQAVELCSEKILSADQLLLIFEKMTFENFNDIKNVKNIKINENKENIKNLKINENIKKIENISSKTTKNPKLDKNVENIEKIDQKNVLNGKKEQKVVGMVGYPNVGKSSIINILFGTKRVRVGVTPGKTKHIQTLNINSKIQLCDCPGLVFPSLTNSRAEMLCSGILSAEHSKNLLESVKLICSRVPTSQFMRIYKGVPFPANQRFLDYTNLLKSLASSRGWLSACKVPNVNLAARQVVKDYISGELLFCFPPVDCSKEQKAIFFSNFNSAEKIDENGQNCENGQNFVKIDENSENFDNLKNFKTGSLANSKGVKPFLYKEPSYYDNKLGNSKKKHNKRARKLKRIERKEFLENKIQNKSKL